MLGALVADAKLAGELDGNTAALEPEVKLEFEVYHRNHPNPPRAWLEQELEVPEGCGGDGCDGLRFRAIG